MLGTNKCLLDIQTSKLAQLYIKLPKGHLCDCLTGSLNSLLFAKNLAVCLLPPVALGLHVRVLLGDVAEFGQSTYFHLPAPLTSEQFHLGKPSPPYPAQLDSSPRIGMCPTHSCVVFGHCLWLLSIQFPAPILFSASFSPCPLTLATKAPPSTVLQLA